MAEHKHAEVLRAIADGKEVQYKLEGKWMDVTDLKRHKDPITHNHYEWRVKPEPKPDYVKHIGIDKGNGSTTKLRNDDEFPLTIAGWDFVIKINFDGETKEPKSVELVK